MRRTRRSRRDTTREAWGGLSPIWLAAMAQLKKATSSSEFRALYWRLVAVSIVPVELFEAAMAGLPLMANEPPSEKARLLLDAGRIAERAGALDKARAAYAEAVRLDPEVLAPQGLRVEYGYTDAEWRAALGL